MAGGSLILGLVFSIVGAYVCYNRAKELNREPVLWAAFGFLMPIIAMIWIYCLKPKHDHF